MHTIVYEFENGEVVTEQLPFAATAAVVERVRRIVRRKTKIYGMEYPAKIVSINGRPAGFTVRAEPRGRRCK